MKKMTSAFVTRISRRSSSSIEKWQKKKINKNSDTITSSDDDNYLPKKRNIKYERLVELSSYNIIQELQKLSVHELKVLYNRYFSSKL